MNITPKIFTEQMKTRYNAIINEHGIALFKTKEDAKNALDWIESALVLNKII